MTMPDPLIVVFPRGQLSELDKARMDEAGIIAVEADDPKAVQQLRIARPLSCDALTGDAIVAAALRAIADQEPSSRSDMITSSGRAAHAFVSALADAIKPKDQDHA